MVPGCLLRAALDSWKLASHFQILLLLAQMDRLQLGSAFVMMLTLTSSWYKLMTEHQPLELGAQMASLSSYSISTTLILARW